MKIIELIKHLTIDDWQGWFIDWRGGHLIGFLTGLVLGYLWGYL